MESSTASTFQSWHCTIVFLPVHYFERWPARTLFEEDASQNAVAVEEG
jgi:hypothetical protein